MISVVMASYLGYYPGAAGNRAAKLRRAIKSFLEQNLGELIVVSDGCTKTKEIVDEFNAPNIKFVMLDKQPLFSGEVRQAGIKAASYEWICYLDSDDEFTPTHLAELIAGIDGTADWYFRDDIVVDQVRNCIVSLCRIGTSCILHKRDTPAKWPSGYNHDWGFIEQLGPNYKKIPGAGYIVQHIPNSVDN